MAMTETRDDDIMLDPFFAAARARPPYPDPAFVARLVAAVPDPARGPVAPQRWRFGGLVGLFGGWGLGGLATAAAAGLWLGFAGADHLALIATGDSGATVEAEASATLFADSDILVLAGR